MTLGEVQTRIHTIQPNLNVISEEICHCSHIHKRGFNVRIHQLRTSLTSIWRHWVTLHKLIRDQIKELWGAPRVSSEATKPTSNHPEEFSMWSKEVY